MTINTLPNKTGNSESLKNNHDSCYAYSWQGFAEDMLQVVLFMTFKWAVKKHRVVKVLLAL